jgi:DNA-binding XRE family transcriptional regulator
MDNQDWTPVVIKRRYTKKEAVQKGMAVTQVRDSERNERQRLTKLENNDVPSIKKRVHSESIQELIRKRIEMKLTQDKADSLCSFPKHTFREIEAHRVLPTEEQKRRIQQNLSVQLKIDTIQLS